MMRALLGLIVAAWASVAQAQVLPGPGLPVAATGGFSLTQGTALGSSATTTTIAYGTATWGSGCNALIFPVEWYNTGAGDSVSSMAIGGNSAPAQIASVFATVGGGNPSIDAWQLNSPAGTSGTVGITYSAAPSFSSGISPYCLVSAHTTPGTATHATAASTTVSTTVTVPAGGSALIMATGNLGGTITFTNATPDTAITTGGAYFAYGHTTATGSVTITATVASSQNLVIAAIPFGP